MEKPTLPIDDPKAHQHTPLCPAENCPKLPEMVANSGVLWRLSRIVKLFPEFVVPLLELDVVTGGWGRPSD